MVYNEPCSNKHVDCFGKQSQNIYNLHRKKQNQTLFNNVPKACQHTDNMDAVLYTLFRGKCLTAGSLEKSCDFCSVLPCPWCQHSHRGQLQTIRVPVRGTEATGAQSALRSWDEQALAQHWLYPGCEWRKRKTRWQTQDHRVINTQKNACFLGSVRQTQRFHRHACLLWNIRDNLLHKSRLGLRCHPFLLRFFTTVFKIGSLRIVEFWSKNVCVSKEPLKLLFWHLTGKDSKDKPDGWWLNSLIYERIHLSVLWCLL